MVLAKSLGFLLSDYANIVVITAFFAELKLVLALCTIKAQAFGS
jgi:hypothetical protein